MKCGSWDMVRDSQAFLSFWAILCPFTPLATSKIKILKMKKTGDIIILHKCTKNHDHILHCSWGMACDRCNFYFSFWAIFSFYRPNGLKNQNYKIKKNKKNKNKKKQISLFHTFDQKYDMMYGSSDMVHNRKMDRPTNWQKKWHIEVGAPPKNCNDPTVIIKVWPSWEKIYIFLLMPYGIKPKNWKSFKMFSFQF